jgi:alpha-glutamyl/putrescinyl thymine pyrophosphorylase clade 1
VSNKWDFLNLPIQPNDNFDVYWRWMVERLRIFEHRLAGEPLVAAPPGDKFLSTLATYSFCNPFRVLDTGSQIVVCLQQDSDLSPEPVEVFFRTALYRAFNSPETINRLIEQFGGHVPSWKGYDFSVSSEALGKVEARIGKLYRGAYMFNDSLVYGGDRNGEACPRKYQGSLRLVQRLIEDGVVERVCEARTVEEIFNALNNEGKYLAFSGGFWPCSWPTTWLILTLRGREKMTSGRLEAATVTPMAWSYASVDRSILTTTTTFESWRKSYGDSGKNRTAVLQLSVIHPFDSSASGN